MAYAESKGMRFVMFKNGKNIGERDLDLGDAGQLRFVPVAAGSKRGGVLQTIIRGLLMIASPST